MRHHTLIVAVGLSALFACYPGGPNERYETINLNGKNKYDLEMSPMHFTMRLIKGSTWSITAHNTGIGRVCSDRNTNCSVRFRVTRENDAKVVMDAVMVWSSNYAPPTTVTIDSGTTLSFNMRIWDRAMNLEANCGFDDDACYLFNEDLLAIITFVH
jgi:hypothetical protein